MRVIVAGSRHIIDYRPVMIAIKEAANLQNPIIITELICGMAPGVDETGYWFAKMARIPIKEMPADWDRYGKAAGPIRNRNMAEYGEALIAIWDGITNGTRNMIENAQEFELRSHTKMWP